jgi:polynucleotide 5'-hydroxyl-kinase GRC3/NOL9
MLAKFSTLTDQRPHSIVICGPKSSGKSTFAKLLTNRLLFISTDFSQSANANKKASVALLDLDPGQPEYSPPGQLSLVHILEPNFGPPFTHPIPGAKSKIIRSHSIVAISPSLDPSLYMACVADLLAHYRNLLSTEPNCPLVVNTPGWVLGTGLEILMEIITNVRPSNIIYMSQDGPAEVVESLRDVAKSARVVGIHPTDIAYMSPNRPRKVVGSTRGEARSVPVLTLPSQASEYTTRTAVHLRTMQAMSYFHLDTTMEEVLTWSGLPLTSVPPWEIRYSNENPGILGVMCYGEQPPATLLADTITGSLVAVVVIDDLAAIPGWTSEGEDNNLPSQISKTIMETDDTEIRAFDQNSLQPMHVARPLIVRTLDEDIPYFNPANAISLHPRYSHSIGLALVRGVDVARRLLQVLTPIPPRVIEEINEAGKSIVLINGKLDTPGWAYTEELTQKLALDKASRKNGGIAVEIDDEVSSENDPDEGMDGTENRSLGDGFQNAPWIEKFEGSQGRGIGARVWRVRRDLGRTGDGGD